MALYLGKLVKDAGRIFRVESVRVEYDRWDSKKNSLMIVAEMQEVGDTRSWRRHVIRHRWVKPDQQLENAFFKAVLQAPHPEVVNASDGTPK